MSQENVETIQHAFEAYNSGDPSVFLDLYDSDIVLRISSAYIESGTYHGAADVEHWYRRWFASFGESYRMTLRELIDVGDSVVVTYDASARGRSSGAEVGWRSIPLIFTMRGGKIIRIDHPVDLDEALEAVGLSEQNAHG